MDKVNGYVGEKEITSKDPHYGWDLGNFFVSGFTTDVTDSNGVLLFKENDILVFRTEKASSLQATQLSSDVPENAVKDSNVYFLYRCSNQSTDLYKDCNNIIKNSMIRGGHAIYKGVLDEIETAVEELCKKQFDELDTVIDDTVTAKAQTGDIGAMVSLFNSVSFRDFVMTGYDYRCAITGNVIRYKSFMNLEAAHIWPKSHNGLYLPCNGIALCRDMHWAFDKGMFTVDDNYRVIVHPDIESDYLKQFNNKQLYIPENAFFRPDINNLRYHRSNIFGLFKTAGSLVKATGYLGNAAAISGIAAEPSPKYGE